jgi:hypothetical protein
VRPAPLYSASIASRERSQARVSNREQSPHLDGNTMTPRKNKPIARPEPPSYPERKLQELLDTLNAQEPLPLIGSDAYRADPDDYTRRREAITELEHEAEIVALLTVPPEVEVLLRHIKARRRVLWHMDPMPGDPTYVKEEKHDHE